MDIFSRYSDFIQDFIYRSGWQDLRAIQVAAGDAIFNTDQNVLLCASTASGKTEAAFFPILTEFAEDPPQSVGCLYIAPLKALINDQFIRLNDLCEEGHIPVWHWHGDVSSSHKKKLLKHPSGILQITPESLEALLMHKHSEVPKLFGDLRYVVIDEIHSLLRGDRGGQCMCLVQRLCRLSGANPRRIGLSATIGDPKEAGRFLAAGSGRSTVIPNIQAKGMRWRLSMEHFYNAAPQASDIIENPEKSAWAGGVPSASMRPAIGTSKQADVAVLAQTREGAKPTDKAPLTADPGMGYIFEHTRGRKCLVFSNSREECEEVTTTLRAYCEYNHEPDRFLIHHGNLSTAFRETAEDEMRDDDSALTTCTTATLELGIDIGKLERAFQINAPFTVSAFLQRMGRTGRRGEPCEMWFVMREEHAEARDLLPDKIPWALLQGIALVQFYLEERWVEPPRKGRLPFSLLYHQTMSTLASGGEMSPAELASRVLTLAPFENVTRDDFRILINDLIEKDHIQLTEDRGLIVGLAGERITNSFKFYAVFQENEEYSVRCESQEIGTIVKPPPIGDRIAIAGHVWVVEEVDRTHHQVYCHMIKGRVPAYFGDEPGDIHTKILERMRQVLLETCDYPYLLKNAQARLMTARVDALHSGLGYKPLVCLGGNMYCLTPWLGSYAFLALERFLRIRCAKRLGLKGFNSVRPYFCQFTLGVSEQEFYRVLKEEMEAGIDPMELLYPKEVPVFDKYDDILPEELVRRGFACGVLDIEGLRQRISEWTEGI
ncbi:MAG: DEAD/DEAH box helicase [Lachnospiraceae bacterium]|nr:DEAD/DEAH box helicase [Lachnospiraceae bacterium]